MNKTRLSELLNAVANILDKRRQNILAYWLRLYTTSGPGKYCPTKSNPETLQNSPEQRKAQPYSVNVADCQNDEIQPQGECSEPKYEYLSLALPTSATHRVQILGNPKNVDLKFVRRAEHVLSILRVVSSHMEHATELYDLAHADQLLNEVAGLVCGIESKKERCRRQSTCQMQK